MLANLLGKPLFEALGISDVLLELSVTPNRPDMLCHEGVARELEAAFTYAGIPFEKNNDCNFSNKVTITEDSLEIYWKI